MRIIYTEEQTITEHINIQISRDELDGSVALETVEGATFIFTPIEAIGIYHALHNLQPDEFLMPETVALHIDNIENQNNLMRALLIAKYPCEVCNGGGMMLPHKIIECPSCNGLAFDAQNKPSRNERALTANLAQFAKGIAQIEAQLAAFGLCLFRNADYDIIISKAPQSHAKN
jgi:hypothetical protein